MALGGIMEYSTFLSNQTLSLQIRIDSDGCACFIMLAHYELAFRDLEAKYQDILSRAESEHV